MPLDKSVLSARLGTEGVGPVQGEDTGGKTQVSVFKREFQGDGREP